MCLIAIAYHVHSEFPLVVCANRDEWYSRPTQAAHYWHKYPHVFGGLDLLAGGTWLALEKSGRFSAVTNVRINNNEEIRQSERISRGELVKNYVTRKVNACKYMKELSALDERFDGYNLLAGTVDKLFYYSNRYKKIEKLKPGYYVMSNAFLQTPWPKSKRANQGLMKILSTTTSCHQLVEDCLKLLQNEHVFPDQELPDTGVGIEWERMLSSIFIKSESYGTRASTILVLEEKKATFVEQSYGANGTKQQKVEKIMQIN